MPRGPVRGSLPHRADAAPRRAVRRPEIAMARAGIFTAAGAIVLVVTHSQAAAGRPSTTPFGWPAVRVIDGNGTKAQADRTIVVEDGTIRRVERSATAALRPAIDR